MLLWQESVQKNAKKPSRGVPDTPGRQPGDSVGVTGKAKGVPPSLTLTGQRGLVRRRTKDLCPSLCGVRLFLFPQPWIPVFIPLLSAWHVMMLGDFTSRRWQVSFTSVHWLIMAWAWRRGCRAGHAIRIVRRLKPCQGVLGLEMFFVWVKAGQEVHALGTWNADFSFIIRISAKLQRTRTLWNKKHQLLWLRCSPVNLLVQIQVIKNKVGLGEWEKKR